MSVCIWKSEARAHAHGIEKNSCVRVECKKMASSSTTKRKHSVLTLEKKLDIITELRKGKSVRSVSGLFEVPKSTVGDIWKDRDKIEKHVNCQ